MSGATQPPAAQVTVGAVTFDGDLPLFGDPGVPTADLMITNHYERDGHTYAAGMTSPEPFNGSLTGVVRLATVTQLMIAEWTACNAGAHPPVPDPDAPQGWTILDLSASLAMVGGGPGGDPVYRISGTYVYVQQVPEQDHKKALGQMVYPYAPWLKPGGASRTVPAAALLQMINDRAGLSGTIADGRGMAGVLPLVQK